MGHIVRKSQLEATALTQMIEGKRARGIDENVYGLAIIRLWGTMEDQRHTENVPRTQRQSLTRHLHWIESPA